MPLRNKLLSGAISMVLTTGLVGCFDSSDSKVENSRTSDFSLNFRFPDSLTGGSSQTGNQLDTGISSRAISGRNGGECNFNGAGDDPFKNGYEITKFLVSTVATWSCVADNLIALAEVLPNDGAIRGVDDNVVGTADYDPGSPTHFSISSDDSSKVIRLYYAFTQDTPPTSSDDPGFYLTWQDGTSTSGRMILDAVTMQLGDDSGDGPTDMRMDFDFAADVQVNDMFLRFGAGNEWADGLRIKVEKDLTAGTGDQVFKAQGIMSMTGQFSPVASIPVTPTIKMFAVSDGDGNGAAIAQFNDLALPIEVSASQHLGSYQSNKLDTYYFKGDQSVAEPWDYIDKTFTSAVLKGDRSYTGSPSLTDLENYFGLTTGYFTSTCANVSDDCVAFINAIFGDADGFAGQEPNQGSNPNDWRTTALSAATYLDSPYPNGTDWTDAFDFD